MEWRSPALRTPCSQQGRLGEVTHPVGGARGDGGAGEQDNGGSRIVFKLCMKVRVSGRREVE